MFRLKQQYNILVRRFSNLWEKIQIVPSVFIKEHLKENEGEEFLLRVLNGTSCQVKFRNGRFCTGWKKFTSANHLNVGDVCLFELTKNRMSFEVTIIRGNLVCFSFELLWYLCKVTIVIFFLWNSSRRWRPSEEPKIEMYSWCSYPR